MSIHPTISPRVPDVQQGADVVGLAAARLDGAPLPAALPQRRIGLAGGPMRDAFELLPGAFHVTLNRFTDERGAFVKTFAATALAALGLQFERRESFYSLSARGVIRGMHLQLAPHDHDKIVHCAAGAALDVLLDLRPGPGFGTVSSVLLDSARPSLVFVPRGVAHGFKSLADGTLLTYDVTSEHAPSHDSGVRWDSFGFDWRTSETAPVIARRDRGLPPLADFAGASVA